MESRKQKIQWKINPWMVVLGVFVLSTIATGLFSLSYAEYGVFPDEHAHVEFAKSIAAGNGIKFRGTFAYYPEILYSLFISPVFVICRDMNLAHIILFWLNSALMSSAIVPLYLLAKRYLRKPVHIALVTAYGVMSGEMIYATCVMQENLNYPLIMWFFLVFSIVVLEGRTRTLNLCGLGGLLYLVSICKQMNLALVMGTGLFLLIEFFAFADRRRETSKILILVFGTFFVLRITHNYIVNSVVSITSDGANIKTSIIDTLNLERIKQLIYPAIMYVFFTVVATGILPLPVIVGNWNSLPQKSQRLGMLIVCFVTVSICAICILIVPNENLGSIELRYHSRYFFYSFSVIIMLALSVLENVSETSHNNTTACYVLFGVAILTAFVAIIPAVGSHVDSLSLYWLKRFIGNDFMINSLRVIFIVLIMIGIWILHNECHRTLLIYVFGLLLVYSVLSHRLAIIDYTNGRNYHADKKSDALMIDDYFSGRAEDQKGPVLIVGSGYVSEAILECYLQTTDYVYTYYSDIPSLVGEPLDFSQVPYHGFLEGVWHDPSGTEPKYIICDSDISLTGYDEVNLDLKEYHLFKRNRDKIYVERSANGISNDSWVETDPAELMIAGTAGCTSATLELTVDNWLMGHDMVVPYVDGTGYEGTLTIPFTSAPTEIEIPVYKEADSMAYQITITPSESVQPDNGDPRFLSFRITSYDITEEQ